MFLLRDTNRTVTEICYEVGFTSLGTFSRTFRDIVGEPPTAYRARTDVLAVPTCFAMAWMRPALARQRRGRARSEATLQLVALVPGPFRARPSGRA